MYESTLTVEGIYSNLGKIGAFVEQFTRRIGFDSRSTYAVQMAVDEACSNIIEHGYGGEGKGEIYLQFQQLADGIKVIIQDRGAPFDPDAVPAPNVEAPLEERGEGGLGLFLMRQLMDEVIFEFAGDEGGDTNTLILIKRTANRPARPKK